MSHHHDSAEMDACIRACLECYRVCQETATGHCLETGGRHVEPEHFRLMLSCAEVCRTAAALMLDHVNMQDKGDRIRKAVSETLNIDNVRTGDLGGRASTKEYTAALVARIRNNG